MSLIRRERRSAFPEPPIPPFPGLNMYGRTGAPDSLKAMQSSAVWACVRLVASTVAMMPLQAYTLRGAVREPVDMPPLFQTPAAGTTPSDWVYMVMSSLLLRGNAYGQVVRRDRDQYPLQIELFNPDDVTVRRDPTSGALTYKVRPRTGPNAQQPITIPTVNMIHLRAYRIPGLDVGLSPIQQAALTINRDAAIQQFALGYFQDAPHPDSVLTSDQPINAEHAKTIKERLLAAVTGREPLVLGAGLKFTPLSVSPEESQFLATQKYGASEICRFFGVPPSRVPGAEVGNSMTYQNVEAGSVDLLVYTIQWWLTLLESAFSQFLPGKRHVRFDPSVLLRTDLDTRLKATAIGIASHQLTPDEARAMGDLPPLTPAQKKELDLVKLTVSPSGRPTALPGAAPAGEPEMNPNGAHA